MDTNKLGLTQEEIRRKQDIMFRLARLMWAGMLLISELITAEPANWRKDKE